MTNIAVPGNGSRSRTPLRDQRVAPPRAAYLYALPMACGFLAANGIVRRYDEPFGIGHGPRGADPEVAYGVAFAAAAAEAFQQPFLFERMAFLDGFPGSEAKTLGVEWGRAVGRQVLRMRTDDGSEPNEVNYYLGRYRRRTDSLRWRPTGPFYAATPGPAFPSFDRGLYPGHGQIRPWTMTGCAQFRATSDSTMRRPRSRSTVCGSWTPGRRAEFFRSGTASERATCHSLSDFPSAERRPWRDSIGACAPSLVPQAPGAVASP